MNIGIKKKYLHVRKEMQDKISIHDLIGIKEIRNGIVVTDDSFTAILEVTPINFKLKSEREQDAIINKYNELLKKMKISFDVRTISKKEDSRDHLEYIRKLDDLETNENVKAMIEEYEKFVSEISYKSVVRRRFLVFIPYELPIGIKLENVDFKTAELWLNEKCAQFTEAIEKCGSKVVNPSNKNQFAAQILFELLNMKSSEKERILIL